MSLFCYFILTYRPVLELQLYFCVGSHVKALYYVPQNPWIIIVFAFGPTYIFS